MAGTLFNEGLLPDDARKGKPSTHTVQAYVNTLTESYFFYEIKRFDIKGKEFLRTLGKYYIVEKETSYGYVLDDEPRYVDLTYRDQDTPVVTYSADWQNRRQKVQVNVLKKEKDSDKVLSGAIFGLFAAEDITSAGGKVLIEKDTIIELKTTDESGWLHFIADLPIRAKYYLKEIYAPDGYVRATETQEFTFEY